MNLLDKIYNNVKKLQITYNQAVVITPDQSPFEDCSNGAWFTVCDDEMSGYYPTKQTEFCVGFPNIFKNHQGLLVTPDGWICLLMIAGMGGNEKILI